MRLLSEAVTAARYGPATAAHVQSSAAALQELAALVSVGSELTGVRPLHVRVSHFDHGAFLSNQLFSVSVLPVSGRTVQLPPDPVRGPSPPATLLGGGGSATVVEPLVLAVVPNHTVEVQIEVVLTVLATLLARLGSCARAHSPSFPPAPPSRSPGFTPSLLSRSPCCSGSTWSGSCWSAC